MAEKYLDSGVSAHEMNSHVLVILMDMSLYTYVLCGVSVAREEIPGRHANSLTIYKREGCVVVENGSILKLPIFMMPKDDITHPIPSRSQCT